MDILLKESHVKEIRKFAKYGGDVFMQDRLIALFTLIKKRGQPITESAKENLLGEKALEFSDGEFITLLRTGSNKIFYPCTIKIIYLKS